MTCDGVLWRSALGLVLAAGFAQPAHASEPLSSGPNAHIVAIEVDAEPEVVSRVRDVASEVLARLGVRPEVTIEPAQPSRAAPERPRPLAYAYIDLEIPRLPRLVVVDGATSRELTRRTLPETSSLEMSIEAVTLVLYMTLESLLAAQETEKRPEPPSSELEREDAGGAASSSSSSSSSSRSTPPPPEKHVPNSKAEPPFTTEPRDDPEVEAEPVLEAPDDAQSGEGAARTVWPTTEVGVFGRLLALGDSTPVAGAGATLGVFTRPRPARFGLVLLGAAHFASNDEYRGATTSVMPFSARAFAAFDYLFTSHMSVALALGAGADWFYARVRDAPPGAIANATTAVDPVVSALLGARADFVDHLALTLTLGLDLDAAPRSFVAEVGRERHTLLELARFRPSLLVGFTWTSGARQP